MGAACTATLSVAEADCANQVGRLWGGVLREQKQFLPHGIWEAPACHLDRITVLDLRGMDLTDIDDSVALFPNLESVDARDNPGLVRASPALAVSCLQCAGFASVSVGGSRSCSHRTAAKTDAAAGVRVRPPLPQTAARLRTLNVAGTPLARNWAWRGARLTSLPQVLLQQQDLERLDVSENNLTSLPPEMKGFLKLQALNVSSNRLSTLPNELVRLSASGALRELDAANNRIAHIGASLFPLLSVLDALDIGE